jgi:hypothetical protein
VASGETILHSIAVIQDALNIKASYRPETIAKHLHYIVHSDLGIGSAEMIDLMGIHFCIVFRPTN